jgi:hypothetical protein
MRSIGHSLVDPETVGKSCPVGSSRHANTNIARTPNLYTLGMGQHVALARTGLGCFLRNALRWESKASVS